ncbi:Duplicated homeodomain-like superfamily protein [Striga hermonthica]|uniref:Duplicated homeodomain-like superfamily protein n=1 Tax=Striga hermonthica TaxID=68872 RepID=A0A9N7MRH6_STRHE|nr:Duplicated homeodomain-like superfamily protein [Striga hermonthica]
MFIAVSLPDDRRCIKIPATAPPISLFSGIERRHPLSEASSRMNIDWTLSSCSWIWEEDIIFKNECNNSEWTTEEDKDFESALTLYNRDPARWERIVSTIPGSTIREVRLHYEALTENVLTIEPNNNHDNHEQEMKLSRSVDKGIEEEEYRRLDSTSTDGKIDITAVGKQLESPSGSSRIPTTFGNLSPDEGVVSDLSNIVPTLPEKVDSDVFVLPHYLD